MAAAEAFLILARTNARGRCLPFSIKQADRLFHLYVIGKTGVGKTTLLENLVIQDIDAGRGCALIDPHGDLVERVASRVPAWRREDLVYLDALAPIQNKVGAFLSDRRIQRIVAGPGKSLRLRSIMDEGKVLLVNLAKGKTGDDSSSVLGGLLVTALGLAAYSRADIPEAQRRAFFIYIDEFQNFTTLSIANMLSELRKYRVGMILAHQYLAQLDPDIRHAVLGNAGTLIIFRVGPEDAILLAREFDPLLTPLDLMNLPNYEIYLKLMIDGTPSPPFSASTMPSA
jgi:hypothetical protein